MSAEGEISGLLTMRMKRSPFLHLLVSGIYYKWGKPYDYYKMLRSSQHRPFQDLEDRQLAKLNRLLDYHSKNSRYYRELLHDAGIKTGHLHDLSDIQRVPMLSKSRIKKIIHTDRLSEKNFTQNVSGGSTGAPTTIYSSKSQDDWNKAAVIRTYDWLGYRPGNRRMRLFAAPTRKGIKETTFRNRLKNLLANTKFIDAAHLYPELMDQIITDINLWQPQLITGYTSVLAQIGKHMISTNQVIEYDGLVIQNAAEPLPLELRETIEEGFNAPVFNHYGTREIGYIAHECPRRAGLHVHMEHILLEVVNEDGSWVEEGETGEVLITQLENFAMPVIRYQIEDLSSVKTEPCGCGRNLQLLTSIIGRTTDAISLSDGSKITGLTFPHVFKDFKIDHFQVYQRKDYSIDVQIVVPEDLNSNEVANLVEKIGEALREIFVGLETRIIVVESISRTGSGKFRPVVSEAT